jgi:hypothetical protein
MAFWALVSLAQRLEIATSPSFVHDQRKGCRRFAPELASIFAPRELPITLTDDRAMAAAANRQRQCQPEERIKHARGHG